MEPSNQRRKITQRCLLWILLGIMCAAAYAHFVSPMVRALAVHSKDPVMLVVLTKPAMIISYIPSSHQAEVRVLRRPPQKQQDRLALAHHLLQSENLPFAHTRFFEPTQTDRETFWDNAIKHYLADWRYNPLLISPVAGGYLSALHEKRTNLSPAEFLLLGIELTRLEASDFILKFSTAKKAAKKIAAPADGPAPNAQEDILSRQDRPLILEVLNASGKRGLAQELTQYLRDQNSKGLLRVDVLQYENYPTTQDTSWLEDLSGRRTQLKQLGHAIGIKNEIRSGTADSAIYDARIIIGKDFKLP